MLAETRYLRMVSRGGWDYVQRPRCSGVVAIVGLTDDRRVVLVEQYRTPVRARVIEFPAGLAGDVAGEEEESLEQAARRELFEETGYTALRLERLLDVASSAGLTDELITIFLALGLERTGPGGGDDSEDIIVHEAPLDTIDEWLAAKIADGAIIDTRVHAGLYLLHRHAPPGV